MTPREPLEGGRSRRFPSFPVGHSDHCRRVAASLYCVRLVGGGVGPKTMKLVIAVVQNEDADSIVESLLERQFRATRLASTGGFLRRGNTTLLIGVEDHDVETVLDVIRTRARTRIRQDSAHGAVESAAATVFVIPLEDYQRL
ncbi:Protein of unknown function (DUF970) superfamily [Thermomicrobium roseum DSM 5159]|uniref:Transcriptional regulator n=2 Tax=Thermomicrobiaceae TaxID=189777 RepID=B9KZ19_THERP|nr:Protein of unknown function (DUF970) superfamily [Thermomicrobium roseum DSM 5159]